MAPPTRPTKKAPGAAKPAAKKPAAAAAPAEASPAKAAPTRKRNQRPKCPVFYEDAEAGTLMELGSYLGADAEDALKSYLAALDDDDREQAIAASDYVVFTAEEGMVKLTIVPPTEPLIARR